LIDIHSHVLPGIDDGAKDVPTFLEMARIAVAKGTRALVCTPHHHNGTFENIRAEIERALDTARELLRTEGIALELEMGGEVRIHPDVTERYRHGLVPTYGGRKGILIEFGGGSLPPGTDETLMRLQDAGLRPVIAHPERQPYLVQHEDRIAAWVEEGILLQVTAMSVTGQFSAKIQATVKRWLQKGWIHAVASDAHDPVYRPPSLHGAFETLSSWMGEDQARILTFDNPRAILHHTPVQQVKMKSGLLGRLFSL